MFMEALGGELGFSAMSYQNLFKTFKKSESELDNHYLEYLEQRHCPNVT